MIWSLGQFILDCDGQRDAANPVCTLSPYHSPPATVDHYALAPTWAYAVMGLLIFAAIVAAAIVRYKRIDDNLPSRADRKLEERKAELDARARIAEAHNSCQNCGVIYSPKLEDIKT